MESNDSLSNKGSTLRENLNGDLEAPKTSDCRKRGGWITFPFIAVAMTGLTIAGSGWSTNLIVYLIQQFNIKSIHASQIYNVVNGCTCFLPVIGAIVADSFMGNFFVIAVSSVVSLLGLILLMLTAKLHSLKPPHCTEGSETCEYPSPFQFAILYSAISLLCIGIGGTRFTLASMGANQFDRAKDQDSFFNWFFFVFYTSSAIGITAIVYVENDIGWGLGFGLCLAINAIGLAAFISGKGYYHHIKPQRSPFTGLARVVVATIRKKKVPVSAESKDYYFGRIDENKSHVLGPTSNLRFLNRAAMRTDDDVKQDGDLVESWRLCTVQQVEDLKTLLRLFPLWSTTIFLSTPIAIQMSLMVLQALRMDRHLGSNLNIPAGSFLVFTLISTSISLSVIDRFLFPTWKRLTSHSMTPLERVGIGHVLNIIGIAGSALVEARRLHVVRSHNLTYQASSITPMSAFWLVAPLAVVGVGEAFHFPGQVALYYQEFPKSLKSTATAMISFVIAIGFYLSTATIDLMGKVTGWVPDNINEGRLDNVFWVMVVLGVINFGYYLVCAMLYTYNNVENSEQKCESVKMG